MRLTRRHFSALACYAFAGSLWTPSMLRAASHAEDQLSQQFVAIEKSIGARMGVAIRDTETGQRWDYRSAERFPMCSTFKLLACAAVLARVDAGQETLDRRIRIEPKDMVTYSPVTKDHVGGEMELGEICAAAMTQSDNTAGNLILASLGGPAGLTAFARSLGDSVTRLDRWETALNEATPGDPRDTTSPEAMSGNLQVLITGKRLSPQARGQLVAWLLASRTGSAKLRAGVPADWRLGDKTGGGDWGTNNDVAVIWPPHREPLLASVYITESKASFEERNAAIAAVGRTMATLLKR